VRHRDRAGHDLPPDRTSRVTGRGPPCARGTRRRTGPLQSPICSSTSAGGFASASSVLPEIHRTGCRKVAVLIDGGRPPRRRDRIINAHHTRRGFMPPPPTSCAAGQPGRRDPARPPRSWASGRAGGGEVGHRRGFPYAARCPQSRASEGRKPSASCGDLRLDRSARSGAGALRWWPLPQRLHRRARLEASGPAENPARSHFSTPDARRGHALRIEAATAG